MEPRTKQEVRRMNNRARRMWWAEQMTYWRCFWSWPFMHAYFAGRCVRCGKSEQAGFLF